MHFRISLEDGTEADSTFDDEPIHFKIGDGTLLDSLEKSLLGLAEGTRKTLQIPPGEGYGYADKTNIHSMARSAFPPQMRLEQGTVIAFNTPSGEELPGTVCKVDSESVEVDFNHPFAGRRLIFEVDYPARHKWY